MVILTMIANDNRLNYLHNTFELGRPPGNKKRIIEALRHHGSLYDYEYFREKYDH